MAAYADVQDEAWQATNIDDSQIARGVSGGPALDARDVNRLERFPRLQRRCRRVSEEGQSVVVCCRTAAPRSRSGAPGSSTTRATREGGVVRGS